MAGSEPRSGGVSPQPHHSDWGRLEAAILSGWRSFWQSVGKERTAPSVPREEADEEVDVEASTLTRMPVSVGRPPRRTQRPGWVGFSLGRPLGAWGPPSALVCV